VKSDIILTTKFTTAHKNTKERKKNKNKNI